MSEAAAALLGGEGGGAPPVDGGGGAPSAPPEWLSGADQDLIEYHGKRGPAWKSPTDVLKSYRELEQKATWSDAVRLPKDAADQASWDKVWKTLGRPDDAKGYGFTATDQADTKIADGMMAAFWRAGLNQAQAESVWGAISELSSTEADDAARTAKNQSDHADLRREWGPSYDQKVTLGARAARAMGIGKDELNAIENALGTRFVLEKMAALGESLREDAGVGVTAGAAAMSAESAVAKASALRGDPAFRERLDSQDFRVRELAQKELSDLYKIAYPDQPA